MVIISSAINKYKKLLKQKRRLPIVKRAEMLAELMRFKKVYQ